MNLRVTGCCWLLLNYVFNVYAVTSYKDEIFIIDLARSVISSSVHRNICTLVAEWNKSLGKMSFTC